jgi:hypothetical protein
MYTLAYTGVTMLPYLVGGLGLLAVGAGSYVAKRLAGKRG